MKGLKRYFTQTTEGPYLEINEDKYICLPGERVFGVVDGFGGSGIGDRASEIIVNTIQENYGSLVADPDVTMPIFFDPSYSIELNALANTTLLAHEYLKNENTDMMLPPSLRQPLYTEMTRRDKMVQVHGVYRMLRQHIYEQDTKII